MRRRTFLVVLLSIACAVGVGHTQAVMTVTGAPFTATWVSRTESATGVKITVNDVARASDGSVYQGQMRDGKVHRIEIIDVPNERRISFTAPTNGCEVTPPPGRPQRVVRTVAQQRAVLERLQESAEKGFDRKGPEISKHDTALGTKVEDGMTVFGQHYVHTRNGDGSVVSEGDTWQTDLGFVLSVTFREIALKRINTSELKDIQRVEPDPRLFQLPAACTVPQEANH